jgi:hypothetical protein
MNEHQAELVTVLAHKEDGRIFQYIKNLIPVTEGERLKAAARVSAEEKKAAAMLQDANRFIEKLHEPRENATHRALLEKACRPSAALAPAPQPSPPPQPQPQQASPSPAVRSHRERSTELRDLVRLAAAIRRDKAKDRAESLAWRTQYEAKRKEIDEIVAARAAEWAAAQTAINADYSGREVGRAFMASLIAKTPSGCRVLNVDKTLDEPMRNALKQLQDQNEFAPAFEKAFWQGAHEAVEQFNQQQAELQADAGRTHT